MSLSCTGDAGRAVLRGYRCPQLVPFRDCFWAMVGSAVARSVTVPVRLNAFWHDRVRGAATGFGIGGAGRPLAGAAGGCRGGCGVVACPVRRVRSAVASSDGEGRGVGAARRLDQGGPGGGHGRWQPAEGAFRRVRACGGAAPAGAGSDESGEGFSGSSGRSRRGGRLRRFRFPWSSRLGVAHPCRCRRGWVHVDAARAESFVVVVNAVPPGECEFSPVLSWRLCSWRLEWSADRFGVREPGVALVGAVLLVALADPGGVALGCAVGSRAVSVVAALARVVEGFFQQFRLHRTGVA